MPAHLRVAAALLLAACGGDVAGPRPEPPVPVTRAEDARPLRILFIGNSLTFYNDLPTRTAEIARVDTTLRWPDPQSVTRSSTSLRQHWFLGMAPQRIQAERWDYVVLQEGSQDIVQDPETTEVYVTKYDSLARAGGARTMLFLTWTYGDIPQLQDSVTRVYTRIASHVGTLVAPVGVAWQRALQLNPTLPLYLPDSIHPAPVGTYLAANTVFAALYRRTPAGLAGLLAIGDTNIVTLDSATAALLQTTAWQVTQPYLPH